MANSRAGRVCLRDAGAGREQCERGNTHRVSGFDADDPLYRPGRAPFVERGAFRNSISAGCTGRWPNGCARWIGPGAASRTDRPRVSLRDLGAPRSSGNRPARGHAARGREGRRRGNLQGGAGHPGAAEMASLRAMLAASRKPLMMLGGTALDGASGRRHRHVCAGEPACLPRSAFRRQDQHRQSPVRTTPATSP